MLSEILCKNKPPYKIYKNEPPYQIYKRKQDLDDIIAYNFLVLLVERNKIHVRILNSWAMIKAVWDTAKSLQSILLLTLSF